MGKKKSGVYLQPLREGNASKRAGSSLNTGVGVNVGRIVSAVS